MEIIKSDSEDVGESFLSEKKLLKPFRHEKKSFFLLGLLKIVKFSRFQTDAFLVFSCFSRFSHFPAQTIRKSFGCMMDYGVFVNEKKRKKFHEKS
jgi:hypothetical protein